MTRRPLVIGNWKMNTTVREAVDLAHGCSTIDTAKCDVMVCPPFPWLPLVSAALGGTDIEIGAQDCWPKPNGAWTGGVSITMLAELCSAVIVGHSERRQLFGDSDELVREKLDAVIGAGMLGILCVGESLDVRESGHAKDHVTAQLAHALSGRDASALSSIVVAYEPIWAIGTGVAASAGDAEEMALHVRNTVETISRGQGVALQILYGGSVTATNSAELLSQPNIDGALVGGASLKADQFKEIVASALD